MKNKKTVSFLTLLLVSLFLFPGTAEAKGAEKKQPYKYIGYVDPWIESNIARFFFFQSAKTPMGLMSLRPDDWIGNAWESGYAKNKNYVSGFSHVHDWQLSGIQIMPVIGDVNKTTGCEGWQSTVNHDKECVEPGYHQLFLERYGINAELTATDRVGMHRYTYQQKGAADVIINLGGIAPGNGYFGEVRMRSSFFRQVAGDEIEGYVRFMGVLSSYETSIFFNIKFDRNFNAIGKFDGENVYPGITEGTGDLYGGVFVSFGEVNKNDQLGIKVGVSLTGTEGARKNRIAEIPDGNWNFDAVRKATQDVWENMLGRIDVKGGTKAQRVKFYTDMFHALAGRCIINDADGSYTDNTWGINNGKGVIRHLPMHNGKPEFNMYNYDALWLTQWNLNTLFGLSYPDIYNEYIRSQLQMYKEGGLLPRGPVAGNYSLVMTGAPVISFITGAYNKNIRNFDTDLAWEAMSDAATIGGLYQKAAYQYLTWDEGNGAREYMTMGYVPHDMPGDEGHRDGAGCTLEYAFQDFALANYSKMLNKRGVNIAPLAKVSASSQLNDTHQSVKRAIDGRPARSGIGEYGVEWESNGEYKPWIRLDFEGKNDLSMIKLYDRQSAYSHILAGKLHFSNGDKMDVGELPNDGSPLIISLNKKAIEWVRFEVTDSYGTNIGLNEIEVWDNRDAFSYYMQRSGNWRNLYDKESGLIRPKGIDGTWLTPFDPLDPNDFVESNSWQATFSVSHDLMGLAELMGGAKKMADTLNYAFEKMRANNYIGKYGVGYVSYGNQPGLSAAHVFNYIGYPWLSQYWVRQVKEQTYGATDPNNGYGHHDEDQGQMGSLSALMAMGLFSITGGCGEKAIYEITSPVFDEITIKLHSDYCSGKEFKIITRNNSAKNCYIQKVTLNNKALDNCWFYHDDYAKGGVLEIWLDSKPNYNWGVKQLPPSITK